MSGTISSVKMPGKNNSNRNSSPSDRMYGNKPPIEGVFEEDGIKYRYFLKDKPDSEKWEKRRVGKNGLPIGRSRAETKKVQLSFSVDPVFKSDFERYCKTKARPLSQIAAEAVQEYMINHPI